METPNPTPPPATAPTQTPTPPQPTVIRKSNNAPLIGAIVFLALVIAGAAIFLGTRGSTANDMTATTAPTVAPTQSPSPTASPTIIPLQKQSISKLKDSSFTAYSIEFPQAWTPKTDTSNGVTSTFSLTKGENKIEIYQAPQGGAACIFEGPMPETPANDYTKSKFTEIKAGAITLRRIGSTAKTSPTAYSFCSNSPQSPSTFGVPTIFGVITYTVASPTDALLAEMDKIIASLKSTP